MRTVRLLPLLFLLLSAQVALAKPEISLEMKAEKEVTQIVNGKEVSQRVPADTIEPGELIHYTLTYRNSGNEAAMQVVVDNPIPNDTVYVTDSAGGAGSDISFSIDGGANYKKPDQLTYRVKVDGQWEERKATPDRYTHIRWVIERIDAQAQGTVNYSVRIK